MTQSSPNFIFTLDRAGNVVNRFGDLPRQPTAALSRHAGVNGSMVWDSVGKNLIVLPESPYEYRVYSGFGQLLAAVSQDSAGFQSMRLDEQDNVIPSDRILRGALLPKGKLAVEVVKRQVASTRAVRTVAYLEILDRSGQLQATGISVTGFGQLQGANQYGELYFFLISEPTGINVMKAKITSE